MLMLGSKVQTIEGITVFPDHADQQQWWYLPGPLGLAKRDSVPQFTLIRYRPAVADGGVQGGGFLTMEVELKLLPSIELKILNKLSTLTNGRPRLSVVPFDEGTVQIVALNIQGGGGTNAPAPLPGTFVAVEAILGATKPSLAGNNNAVFSLTLSQEGSIILDQAFRQGAMPVGAIYDLKYTALQPALDVEIKANYKRIYDHLSMGIDLTAGAVIYGVPVFLEAGIDLAFEKLKQDGVIEIKVINFANDADAAEKEQWALDFFKQQILAEWFKPTLPPVTFDNGGTSHTTGTGTSTGGASAGGAPAGGASGGGAPAGGASAGGGAPVGGGAPAGGASGGGAPAGGASAGGGAPAGGAPAGGGQPSGGEQPESGAALLVALQPVTREVWAYPFLETERQAARLEKRIEPPTPGYDIQLSQLSTSDQVTLTFLGGETAPSVRINQAEQTLTAQRQLTFDFAPGATLNIEASYPAAPALQQEFRLLFDFDKPRPQGWSVQPPGSSYQGYLNNRTNPLDSRFETSTGGPNVPAGGARGADALRAWLQNSLGSPKRVSVDSYASYEGDPSKAAYNQELTQRRLDVALGIIGGAAQITSSGAHGFDDALQAGRVRDPNDRVVLIRGASAGGQAVVIHGTLTRPAPAGGPQPGGPQPGGPQPGGPQPGGPQPGGPQPGGPQPGGPQPGGPQPGGGPTPPAIPNMPPMGIKLAFSLKKIEQIEDKTFTLRYNRQSTVQRSYAPQGLLRLLAADLDGPPHFIEVDLDSPFFRKLDLEIEAPPVFEQIGLLKSDVSIEYGRPTEPATLKFKDVSFRPTATQVEHASFFLNSQLDLNYSYTTQYHFDPLSGWDGEKLSYDLPKISTLDRTLLVNPFRDFGFMEVKVVPGDLDPGMIDSTEVHLHYEDPGKWSRNKVITVQPSGPTQTWKLRLSDPERREFSYHFVHRLKDGTIRETQPISTSIPSVTVNDPFEEPLIVEFFPNYDGSTVNTLFVKVVYADPTNGIRREEQLRFIGATQESQRLRFARLDSTVNTISFQITILSKDNSVKQLPAVTTENSIIFLGEHLTSESITKRRTAMEKTTSYNTEAYKGAEGKNYGYQQPTKAGKGAETGQQDPDIDKRQLAKETFDKLLEILFGDAGSGQPGGTSKTDAGAPHSGDGTIHTPDSDSGDQPGGTTTGQPSSSGAYTPGTGMAGASGPANSGGQTPSIEQPTSAPSTDGHAEEAFGIPVGSVRESFRMERAREQVRRAEFAQASPTPTVTDGHAATNKHQSDSNRAPFQSERTFAPSYGQNGRSTVQTMEVVALPAGAISRPESAPTAPRLSGIPLDAYWASFGSAAERAQERIKVAAKQETVTHQVLEMVIGSDDRTQVSNTQVYPWRCICSLLITAQTGGLYLGTGWLVSPRLLLTAGHCVYMADEGGWATQIEVIPGRNGGTYPYGSVISRDFRSVTGWTVDNDRDYDYGAILLPEDQRLGDQLGWFGFANRADSYLSALTLNLSGYPGDGGPTHQDGTQWFNSRAIGAVSERQLSYEIDTYGGQSGSPVWELSSNGSRYGVGIHTWGTTVNNGATRITQDVFDNIISWTAQVT